MERPYENHCMECGGSPELEEYCDYLEECLKNAEKVGQDFCSSAVGWRDKFKKLESSYNKLLEQLKNRDKLSSNDIFIKLRAIAKEFGNEYLWYLDEIIQEFNKEKIGK